MLGGHNQKETSLDCMSRAKGLSQEQGIFKVESGVVTIDLENKESKG